jgi:hypothetical protein
MFAPIPDPEDAKRQDLDRWTKASSGDDRATRLAGASLFLIFFATLPFVWITLSYDCGPSEDVTGIQLVTGEGTTIKGSQSNVMMGYDETPIEGTFRRGPSVRMMLLIAIVAVSLLAIFLPGGGYALRSGMGAFATLVALSFLGGGSGTWEGQGPPPDAEGGFGPFAAFVVFAFAAVVNGRMAHLDDNAEPPNLFLRALGFGLAVTFVVTVVVFGLIFLSAVLTYEG